MKKRERTYDCGTACPVETALDVIGGRWKGVVLYYLLDGPQRFGVLQRRIPAATQRMLTLQLRELAAAGIVHREVYREVPPKVEYSLTDLGRTLEPILRQICQWGLTYRDHTMAERTPPTEIDEQETPMKVSDNH